ncbi:MAG: dTDP-4-dehydrorhamnose reductase [Bacteroidales bacterium]|nr:dTDP-4-dehydrorhamnose reductase [Bacteroidales bacterium]MDD4685076.1 dTDP-4-dehydrorhamnose reductase [Bacteroidales bacterium]
MKTILVTGGNGQLGSSLKKIAKDYPDYQLEFTDYQDLDVTSQDDISNYLDTKPFFAIINCAAYTAVDKAETDIEKARELNSMAPLYLAIESEKRDMGLIHISTDYVFGNTKNTPIHPLDTDTVPSSIYGMTKLEGEENIKNSHSCYAIIRTAWLYSEFGTNFVKTMINVGGKSENVNVVYDQVGSPTYAVDLARAIMAMVGKLDSFTSETLHYTNEGVCSWYDFAKKIMELKKLKCTVNPIVSNQFPSPAPRPSYSVLDKQPIKDLLSITIPHWEDSLKECLKKL